MKLKLIPLIMLVSTMILAETVNVVQDYGADPTGITDSTSAFTAMNNYLATITTRPVCVVLPAGIYKVNPKNSVVPLGSSAARLFGLYSDGSVVEGPGIIKIDNSVGYSDGIGSGSEKYWSCVLIQANNCTVRGLGFDGDGTGTPSGFDPNVANIRWQLVGSFSPGNGLNRRGNKVIECHGTDFCGQAVAFQFQDDAVIAHNVFSKHSGMGVTKGRNAIIEGNSSENGYDAPYYLNGDIYGGVIKNNSSRGTSNGSSCDVVGAEDVEVTGNWFDSAAGAGICIRKSGQLNTMSRRIKVHHNTFKTNARYIGAPVVAEILLGRDGAEPDEATDIDITDNTFIINGASAVSADRVLVALGGAHDFRFCRNKVYGTANSNRTIVQLPATAVNVEVLDNKWLGSSIAQKIIFSSTAPDALKIARNELLVQDASGTSFANAGILESDGSVAWSVTRTVSATPVTVATLTFAPAGYNHALVDVDVTQENNRGVVRKRIVFFAYNAVLPVVLENTTVTSVGANPPVVAINVNTGVAKITVASASSTIVSNIGVRVRTQPGVGVVFK